MDLSADPLSFFLASFFGQGVAFVALIALVYGVVWVWGRRRFAAARIHTRRQADGAQIRRELGHTVGALAVGAANATLVLVLHQAGLSRLTTEAPSAAVLVASVLGLVVLNDLWFYGVHRLLHHPALFRHVHAVHHQSVDTNPFSSYAFHVVEAALISGWVAPVALFTPLPLAAFGAAQVIGTANNLMAHLGYEFVPRWVLRVPGLRWMNTATFHSQHHTQLRGNFGLFSRVWDRLFGTALPGYEEAFLARGTPIRTAKAAAER